MNEEELSTHQTNEKEVDTNEKTIYVRGPVSAEKQLEGYGFAEILPVFLRQEAARFVNPSLPELVLR